MAQVFQFFGGIEGFGTSVEASWDDARTAVEAGETVAQDADGNIYLGADAAQSDELTAITTLDQLEGVTL